MSEQEPFLEVELSFCGKKSFFSLDEVEAWIKEEIDFWQWPEKFDHRKRDGNPRAVINAITQSLNQILGAVRNIRDNHLDEETSRLKNRLGALLVGTYKAYEPNQKNQIYLHSSQPEAQYIHSLIESDPTRAAFVAGYFMRQPNLPIDNYGFFDGAVAATLYDLGIKGTCEAQQVALEASHRDWSSKVSEAETINQNNTKAAQEWEKQTEEDRSKQTQRFDEFLEKNQTDVDEFKKRIKAEIALKGPVTYWQEKASDHTVKSWWFGGFTIFAFIVVGTAIFATIEYFAPDLTLDHIKLRHIGLLAIGATVGVWLIRILVRNYLSHVHLSHDASERVAMMKTYLALLEEGKLEDKHRNLVLQALFRPASTGIVKDDAAPPFMAEWLKRTTGTDN